MNYSIPECNMENLEKKLKRIQNKCVKYGCDFKYERVGEHFEEKKIYDFDDVIAEVNGQRVYRSWTVVVKFIDIDVEGVAAINGWRFAASLEHTEKGNILKGISDLELPKRFYDCAPWCEHCKTARDRKHSYVVYHEATGEFKQVGKACLRDFTHGLSAELAALCDSYLKECEEASEWSGIGGFVRNYYEVADYARFVAETIRIFGYRKNDGCGNGTASQAKNLMRCELGYQIPNWVEAEYEEAKAKGFDSQNEESKKLAETVLAWIVENERDDNYFHNLKVACSLEYCAPSDLGLIASAFPAYDRELEYEAERREREEKEAVERERSSWLGSVGERISFKIAEMSVITTWDTQWGTVGVFKLIDENGHECTWKTSKWIDIEVSECIGKMVKATIKELKEYRGIKQTEITRARIA